MLFQLDRDWQVFMDIRINTLEVLDFTWQQHHQLELLENFLFMEIMVLVINFSGQLEIKAVIFQELRAELDGTSIRSNST